MKRLLTPLGTKRIIKKLFGSQLAAARELGFNERTVRYWVMFGAPRHVQAVFRRLSTGEITIAAAREQIREARTRKARRVCAELAATV